MLRSLVVSLVLIVGCIETSLGQETTQSRLQSYLDKWHQGAAFSGATLGVALPDGNVISQRTSSTMIAMPRRPCNPMIDCLLERRQDLCRGCALQLIAEKKISLDDKVEKYLGIEPGFSGSRTHRRSPSEI